MAIENSKLIDKKNYYLDGELDAVAFIEVFPSGKVQVYGKCYDYNGIRKKSHDGPSTGIIAEVPSELLQEVQSTTWQKGFKSPELKAWCDEIWQQAKKIDDWFKFF